MKYLTLLFLLKCCNPDCSFISLSPPIVVTTKTFEGVSVTDSKGKIWYSDNGWHVAQGIILNYNVGDTLK